MNNTIMSGYHGCSILGTDFNVLITQVAEVKEQAERRIAKLNGSLQAAESRCRQLAADHAAASAAAATAQAPLQQVCIV